jgi:hypothetical protein
MAEITDQAELLDARQPVAVLKRHGFVSLGHTEGRRASVIEITKPPFVIAAIEPEAVAMAAASPRYRSARKNFTPAEFSW